MATQREETAEEYSERLERIKETHSGRCACHVCYPKTHSPSCLCGRCDSIKKRNCGVQLKKDDRKEAQTLAEALEGIRRDGRALAQEIKDLTDQLGEGSHFVNELQKIVRNLEGGNEELLHALDDKKEAKKPCRVQKRTENVKRRRSPAPMFTIHEPETAWLESQEEGRRKKKSRPFLEAVRRGERKSRHLSSSIVVIDLTDSDDEIEIISLE